MKKLNSDILTEKEFYDLKIKKYQEDFENRQNIEFYFKNLPYSDEFPRYFSIKELLI